MKKSLLLLSTVFVILGITSYGIVKYFGSNKKSNNDKQNTIVTSFYPEYILTMNIIDSIDDINLINMTSNTSGCLHDYQITSKDMKTLTSADALIINGGGMEPFIHEIENSFAELPIIDSSNGIELLPSSSKHTHNHDEHNHEESENEHSKNKHTHTDEDKDNHEDKNDHTTDDVNTHDTHGDYNSHIWLNPDNYIKQINTISNNLCEIFPEYKETFKLNSKNYIKKIKKLKEHINALNTKNKTDVILFHDSFAYLADICNLNIIDTVTIDSDTSLSAGTIAEIISEVNYHNIPALLCEKQFKDTIATSVSSETNAKVYTLDSLVTGENNKDAYINGMEQNIETLKKIQF